MYLRIALMLVALLTWLSLAAKDVMGQRVQIPSTTIAQGYGAAGTAPSTFAPSAGVTPAPLAPQAVTPPPAFDPYATGTFGQPPPAVPYSYAPPGQTTAPASPWQSYPTTPPTYPGTTGPANSAGTAPFSWQPGTWNFQGQDGYIVQAQRLMQELGFEHTWLYGNHNVSDLEIHRSEVYSTFAIPMAYTLDAPLLVTPGFAANWLEGPIGAVTDMPPGPELPPRIYDAYLDFAWYPQFNQLIGGELGFRTGVWSDFDHVNTDSVRFLGRGLAKISISPTMDILVGVVYLDRVRTKLLPAGGIYCRPTPAWDLYIVFPNPKARKHFSSYGNTEWYYYFAGEYGGGSWTVDRSGVSDRIDINDLRVMFGLEWETLEKMRGHLEAGYVFDREVIFADTAAPPVFKPEDTFMIRGGIDF